MPPVNVALGIRRGYARARTAAMTRLECTDARIGALYVFYTSSMLSVKMAWSFLIIHIKKIDKQ